jgi:hypothetical protein
VLKILFLTSLTAALLNAQPILAQPIHDPPDGADETLPADYSVSLKNPLPTDSLPEFIGYTIRALLGIIGSLALAVFIYGGFLWMTAAGNRERVQKGKNTLTWTAIGLAVIFLSYAIVASIIKALIEAS